MATANEDVRKTLNYLKTQISDLDSNKTWKHLGSYTKEGAWTISGCTPGKPLFIILQNTAYNYSGCRVASISGCSYPDGSAWNVNGNSCYLLGAETGGNTCVFMPNSSTVVLRVGNWFALIAGSLSLHAYN